MVDNYRAWAAARTPNFFEPKKLIFMYISDIFDGLSDINLN